MKVVVTADTHLTKKRKPLPDRLVQELHKADLIIHAGDWMSIEVYHELEQFAPVKGVYGNADETDITEKVPWKDIIEVGGYTIGLTHGHGEKKTTETRVRDAFAGDEVDIIIFGHSHIPMLRYINKTLLLNPGSPTYKRKLPYYSFAILEIEEELHAEMVFFDEQ